MVNVHVQRIFLFDINLLFLTFASNDSTKIDPTKRRDTVQVIAETLFAEANGSGKPADKNWMCSLQCLIAINRLLVSHTAVLMGRRALVSYCVCYPTWK